MILSHFSQTGQLPVSLQTRDNDEKNNNNSRISMRIVSQEPTLPKISLESFLDGEGSMNKNLVLTGCFDYDVSVNMHTVPVLPYHSFIIHSVLIQYILFMPRSLP